MIRIGMVGSDNSHADAFSQLCNLKGGFHGLKMPGARVVAIYGHEPKRTQEVATNGQIPTIVRKAEHMIGMVDLVIVTFRHGDLHARYALPFLKAGIPTFVDKPLAIKISDARQILAVARKTRTLVTSFSTLRFGRTTRQFLKQIRSAGNLVSGTIKGPATLKNEYGGLPFYGCHISELLAEIFGYGVQSVRSVASKGDVHAVTRYRDGKMVDLQFLANATHEFHIVAYGSKGWGQYKVDTAGIYKDGLDLIVKMLRTKKRPFTDTQLLETVKVTDAVVRSYKANGKVIKL